MVTQCEHTVCSLVASCNELCVVHGESLFTIFVQVIEFISVQVIIIIIIIFIFIT